MYGYLPARINSHRVHVHGGKEITSDPLKLVKELNKFHFEKDLYFRQNLTWGLNAVQQTHKHSQETVSALVKVNHQGTQTTSVYICLLQTSL